MEKNKRLNNRGYMLVEIILASAIAFGIAYFIIDLTINLKNKNDDLLVTTLTATDQAIITNGLMPYLSDEKFCDNVLIDNDKKTIKYHTSSGDKTIVVVNDYATIDYNKDRDCKPNAKEGLRIEIPLKVPQIPDENFNVKLNNQIVSIPEVTPDPEPTQDPEPTPDPQPPVQSKCGNLYEPEINIDKVNNGKVYVNINFNNLCYFGGKHKTQCSYYTYYDDKKTEISSTTLKLNLTLSENDIYKLRAVVSCDDEEKMSNEVYIKIEDARYDESYYCPNLGSSYTSKLLSGYNPPKCEIGYEYEFPNGNGAGDCGTVYIPGCGNVSGSYTYRPNNLPPCYAWCTTNAEKKLTYYCDKYQGTLSGSKCIVY